MSARGVGIKSWLCTEELPAPRSQDPGASRGRETTTGSGEGDFGAGAWDAPAAGSPWAVPPHLGPHGVSL